MWVHPNVKLLDGGCSRGCEQSRRFSKSFWCHGFHYEAGRTGGRLGGVRQHTANAQHRRPNTREQARGWLQQPGQGKQGLLSLAHANYTQP